MTKSFGSLMEMSQHLALMGPEMALALHEGLDRCAERIEKTAKAEFGRYQAEVGPFPEWAELADSTKDERAKLGFTENDPLLRTGELRESISHEVDHGRLEAQIGSTSDLMPYHEFGTSKMPARPVLGPAAYRNKAAIEKLVGAALVTGLIGEDRIHSALGYDFETAD